ncbi:hypothetical protein [Paenibacillus sp. GCM10027626]|uniref:hypothetical protein n=1 Tax=Paenibacillus sp. GCM10027626 TaxID=3273411 RepID=UPI0036342CE1
MNWRIWISATIIILLIFWFEWPRIKQNPPKDKAAFVVLLLIGWVLSMFDLLHLPGPTTLLNAIFKPLARMLE